MAAGGRSFLSDRKGTSARRPRLLTTVPRIAQRPIPTGVRHAVSGSRFRLGASLAPDRRRGTRRAKADGPGPPPRAAADILARQMRTDLNSARAGDRVDRRRVSRLGLGLAASLLAAGCSGGAADGDGRPLVVATTGHIHDAGQPHGGAAHRAEAPLRSRRRSAQPRGHRGDVSDMQRARAIVYNGFHLEAQLGEILEQGPRRAVAGPWRAPSPLRACSTGSRTVEVDPGAPHDPHIWNHLEGWGEAVEGLVSRHGRALPRARRRDPGTRERLPRGDPRGGPVGARDARRPLQGPARAGQRSRRLQLLRGRVRFRHPRGPRHRQRPRGGHPNDAGSRPDLRRREGADHLPRVHHGPEGDEGPRGGVPRTRLDDQHRRAAALLGRPRRGAPVDTYLGAFRTNVERIAAGLGGDGR